jgi:drug/metabolite transporter (DMT)-like permease
MKISRLFQPANPLFWILLVLNLLSMALSYIAQNYTLSTLGSTLVIVFSVVNAVLSAGLAWRLVNS